MPDIELDKAFQFDNGLFFGNLTHTFTRDYATKSPSGADVAANSPRFAHAARLLCGAPDVRTDAAGGWRIPVAGGVGTTGTEQLLAVFVLAGSHTVELWRLNSNGTVTVLYSKVISYSSGVTNILKGDPADTDQNVRHTPTSHWICHGLWIAVCTVHVLDGSVWEPRRTSVCYWDQAGFQGWHVLDPGVNTQAGKSRGAGFQQSGYRVLNSGPVLKAWFAIADYVHNFDPFTGPPSSDKGTCHIFKIERTEVAVDATWTVGPLVLVAQLDNRVTIPLPLPNTGQHTHLGYIERFGTKGLRLVLSVGDSWARNRVIVATRTNEDYDLGGWTINDDVHGRDVIGDDPSPPVSVGEGFQFAGNSPRGSPTVPLGHAIGADETIPAICLLTSPSNPANKLNFTWAYGPAPCSVTHAADNSNFMWLGQYLTRASPESGGVFAAEVRPGYIWKDTTEACRVIFSLDGQTWGQCWAPNENTGEQIAITKGRIFYGSKGLRDYGLRSIPIPSAVTARPLLIGPGGTNKLASVSHFSGTNDGGTTVTLLEDGDVTDAGYALPPCLGPIYRCSVVSAPGVKLGIWRLTADGAIVPSGNPVRALIKVRMWIFPIPWGGLIPDDTNANPYANMLTPFVALGRAADVPDPAAFFASSRELMRIGSFPSVTGWICVTLDTDTTSWLDEATGDPNAPPSALALGIRLSSRLLGDPFNPCHFLVAFDSVQTGAVDHSEVPLPAGTSSFAPETLKILGLSCQSSWTTRFALEMADDGTDQTIPALHRPTGATICTLYENSGKHIQIRANFSDKRIDFVLTSGGTPTTVSLTATGHDPDPPGSLEEFYFLRGSPLLIAVKKSGTTYTFFASVGGTTVASLTVPDLPDIRPAEIRSGDAAMGSPEACFWYGGRINDLVALSDTQIIQSLRAVDFFAVV